MTNKKVEVGTCIIEKSQEYYTIYINDLWFGILDNNHLDDICSAWQAMKSKNPAKCTKGNHVYFTTSSGVTCECEYWDKIQKAKMPKKPAKVRGGKNPPLVSKCCGAPVNVGGIGDFDDQDEICTRYYECTACGKPCDEKPAKKKTPVLTEDMVKKARKNAGNSYSKKGQVMTPRKEWITVEDFKKKTK